MEVRVLSIDLDGTLVDTAAEIAEAANRALEEHGIARRPQGEIVDLIGAGTRELMLKLLARRFLAEPALADRVQPQYVLDSLERHYAETAGTSAAPYPGCREALLDLRSAGLLLACVTNKELRHTQRVLEATGLAAQFDLVVGGDSLPEKRPHASVLRHVLQRLGATAERSAHLGDSATDIAAARNAGVAAWAVPWGYNAGRAIADARPDRIFASFAEVAAHMLQAQRWAASTSRHRTARTCA